MAHNPLFHWKRKDITGQSEVIFGTSFAWVLIVGFLLLAAAAGMDVDQLVAVLQGAITLHRKLLP